MTQRLQMLPFHLSLAAATWLSASNALKQSKHVFPGWSGLPVEPLQAAVQSEARRRLNDLLAGVERYLAAPYGRTLKEPPAIWCKGSARLLDYGAPPHRREAHVARPEQPMPPPRPSPCGGGGGAVLLVPSLINRYYVLDLSRQASLVRYLSARGLRCFILDWGSPSEAERNFGCAEYVTEYLRPALDKTLNASGRKQAAVIGYCMGGVLALTLAQLVPKKINGIGLLATPWDFHAADMTRLLLDTGTAEILRSLLDRHETVPAAIIQTLFHCIDPWAFHRKFSEFAEAPPGEARRFMDLQAWVSDGVPLAHRVARECLIDWAHHNALHRGAWKVGGERIDPSSLRIPAFVAAPQEDRIVPPGSVAPLISQLRDKTVVRPSSGHVGMVVGAHARAELWRPLAEWLNDVCSPPVRRSSAGAKAG